MQMLIAVVPTALTIVAKAIAISVTTRATTDREQLQLLQYLQN